MKVEQLVVSLEHASQRWQVANASYRAFTALFGTTQFDWQTEANLRNRMHESYNLFSSLHAQYMKSVLNV
jgi:hypothetical protein